MRARIGITLGLWGACLVTTAVADEQLAEAERLFVTKVKPLLSQKCFACHGAKPDEIEGELDLTTRQGMLAGGESDEPALVPHKPGESSIYAAIRWKELEMPPKENDRLNVDQIEQVRQWIAAGAPWPSEKRQRELLKSATFADNDENEAVVATSGGLSSEWTNRRYKQENLWAYQPLMRPKMDRCQFRRGARGGPPSQRRRQETARDRPAIQRLAMGNAEVPGGRFTRHGLLHTTD